MAYKQFLLLFELSCKSTVILFCMAFKLVAVVIFRQVSGFPVIFRFYVCTSHSKEHRYET
ncbi:MAG: hypothetical protein EAZ30_16545 [Betaproteobacteria bacterium]|nr:MAG: hypothetical protein EAZ43_11875 [Betaproteobacteria bacterium]TAG44968.1 MAG: hypothetical protein EAZ30_16545 [Betaproteobacteria bacterium]